MRIQTNYYKKHNGQAISEFLIVAAVLVPLLLLIASFANLLDVNTTATKAARFAGWERTVTNTNQGVSNAEITTRIEGNIQELFMTTNKWSDFAQGGKRTATNLPSIVDLGAGVSTKTDFSGSITHNFNRVQNSTIGARTGLGNEDLMSPQVSIPLDSDNSLLKIAEVVGYRETNYRNQATPYDDVAGESRFHIDASAPMVADGWIPNSEDGFTDTIEELSKGGKVLGKFENVAGSSVINFLGFQEMRMGRGDDGLRTVAEGQSEILPSDLGEFVE